MSHIIYAVVALVCICCASFLLLSPMDRIAVLLGNSIGKLLFPRLDPYRRHRKMASIAGIVLVIILTAGITAVIIKAMNRLPHH